MQLTQNALFEKVPKNWAEALPPSFGQSPKKSISLLRRPSLTLEDWFQIHFQNEEKTRA